MMTWIKTRPVLLAANLNCVSVLMVLPQSSRRAYHKVFRKSSWFARGRIQWEECDQSWRSFRWSTDTSADVTFKDLLCSIDNSIDNSARTPPAPGDLPKSSFPLLVIRRVARLPKRGLIPSNSRGLGHNYGVDCGFILQGRGVISIDHRRSSIRSLQDLSTIIFTIGF